MPDEVTLDVTTIEENVTVETTAGDVVEIQVVAPAGPAGDTGPAGPNSVTSATTSDGTANLSIADLEVVGGEIYTDGDYSQIYTQGTDAHIFTLGSGAEIFTEGELAQIYTTGASAQIYTAGAGATIGTQGANATIYTQGANATISTAGSAAHIQTSHASAAVKSTNFAAVESGGASLVDGSFQPCLTWSAGGRNLTIPSGTATTFNTTSYTYGTGAAAAHRTALGLTTLATTTPAANVATFLESPTSANLAAAVTGETGSGSLVFGTSPSLTSPTIGTSATFNATTYTYGSGAAAAMNKALGYMRVVRTTDLGRATSGSLADDDVLIVALDASSVYKVSYVFLSSNTGRGGMGSQINYSGTLLGTVGDSIGNSTLATSSATASIVVSTAATVGTVGTVIIRTNTAGNLSYAWRNYGTGTSTNRAGSLLDITKLA